MDYTLSNKAIKIFLLAAAALILAALIALHYAQAIIVSAPGVPILEGDIDSTEIEDKTILDRDVNEEARISGGKLFYGSAGPIAFGLADGVGTSSVFNFATSTGFRLGVATATPGANIGVAGSVLVEGRVLASSIEATSTTNFGGVTYTWPTADGTANQSLSTNGSGTLSWAAASGWASACRAAATGATSTLSCDKLPAREQYMFRVILNSVSAASAIALKINGDTGSNFKYKYSENNGAYSAPAAQPQFNFTQGNTVGPYFATGDLSGLAGTAKQINIRTVEGVDTTTAPTTAEFVGLWSNTTANIGHLQIFHASATWGANSVFEVWVSPN